jgi:tetratricopeptide (TPR) repeat protein
VLARQQIQYDTAHNFYTQSLMLYRQLKPPQPLALARVLNDLGIVLTARKQFEQAQVLYQESLELCDQFDDSAVAAAALFGLSVVANHEGKFELAHSYLASSLRAAEEANDVAMQLRALNGLGEVARAQGQLEAAQNYYARSLAHSQQLGHKWGCAAALQNLGYVEKQRGNLAQATTHFLDGLARFEELDDPRGIAECLVGIGAAQVALGDAATSVQLLVAAKAVLQMSGVTITQTDQREYDAVAAQLGDQLSQALAGSLHVNAKLLIEHALALAKGLFRTPNA